ncbi:MAG TPA: hypothetical protein VGN57_06280 [Pirellulaceae bacterium]|jgi:hypothetical protein|nr:hypothetical protein [Pirellulaceae bacterium]
MLNLLLDAVALAFLIKLFRADELAGEFALTFAGAGAIAAVIVAFLCVPHLGPLGYVAAGAFVAVGLACSLNLFFDVEIRKALAIGALFAVLHAVIGLGLWATLEGRVHHRLILPLGPPAQAEREFEKIEIPAEEFRKLEPDVQRFFQPKEAER